MTVTKMKRARELIPGDRLVLSQGERRWTERVVAVVLNPIAGVVRVRTRQSGETMGEMDLDPMLEVEVEQWTTSNS